VTLFYAELDPESGALSFLNAGHNPPLIVHSAGTVEQLASGGLPLGIKRDAEYREGRTRLQRGEAASDPSSEASWKRDRGARLLRCPACWCPAAISVSMPEAPLAEDSVRSSFLHWSIRSISSFCTGREDIATYTRFANC